jgi:chromosome segregation ATPase
MATIEITPATVSYDDLLKMYRDAESDLQSAREEIDGLEYDIRDLNKQLDDAASEDEIAGLNAAELAEAIDMLAAGDTSGALWTIRRACADAKVELACDKAMLALKCLVPA